MLASWVSQATFNPPGLTVAVAKDRAIESLMHSESICPEYPSGRPTPGLDETLPQAVWSGEDRLHGLDIKRLGMAPPS